MSWPKCPGCGRDLKSVPTPAWMNEDQFDAVKPGDYFCETCPSNDRGQRPLCYWWRREIDKAEAEKIDRMMHV